MDEKRQSLIRDFQRVHLNTTPGDAMMLRILIGARNAKRGVEIGVASGFGAINMGISFERNRGQLYSFEIDPRWVSESRQNIRNAGLENTVTVIEGDALRTLPALDGPIDFVFLDAVKKDYLRYLKAVESKLAPGAVVVADNVIVHAREMADYLEYVTSCPDYETAIVRCSEEKGDGMAVSYKIR